MLSLQNAHFAISHYAGIVSYNVTNWLEKNKDPVNDTVVEIFKSTSSVPLLTLYVYYNLFKMEYCLCLFYSIL